MGMVFSTVGKREIWKKVDGHRKVRRGCSEEQLSRLAERRNRIAHTGDRAGGGRAHLALRDVEAHLKNARSIVEALDAVLQPRVPSAAPVARPFVRGMSAWVACLV